MLPTLFNNLLPVLIGQRQSTESAHQEKPDTYRFMQLASTSIRYSISGSGSTCIAISADPPVPLEACSELIEKLSKNHTVVAFEAPGFGFSHPARLNSRHDFNTATRNVMDFLVKVDRGPYVLALPCILGFSALRIAHENEALVSQVVLIQTPSWPEALNWRNGRDPRKILQTPVLGQLALLALGRKRVERWFADVITDSHKAATLTEAARESFDKGACFSLASCFQTYMRKDPKLSRIRQPCLIVWGNEDASHCRTDKSSSRSFCENFHECILNGVGHSPELEDPDRFVHELNSFLKNNC